jgi:DNA anti-recombination protein RmuC
MTEHEEKEMCRMRFNSIEKWQNEADRRFDEGTKTMHDQDVTIGKLLTKMDTLTESIKGLSKALWGALCGATMIGLGFIIWFIQTQ